MRFLPAILFQLLVCHDLASQTIRIYKDYTSEIEDGFSQYRHVPFHIYYMEDHFDFAKFSTDTTYKEPQQKNIVNDTNFSITYSHCSIERKGNEFILYTTEDTIAINVHNKQTGYTYKLIYKTYPLGISIRGGYIPALGHHEPMRITPDVFIDNRLNTLDTFKLVSCLLTVTNTDKATVFTEKITNGKITQWDTFSKLVKFGYYIFYEDIIVTNGRGELIKTEINYVIQVNF